MIQDPLLRQQPELIDVLNEMQRNIFLTMNCHAIAQIKKFNPANQTVEAQLAYKKAYFEKDPNSSQFVEKTRDYAALVDCPVIVMSGGAAALTMPIQAGDYCLILFNDRDIDAWWATGQINQAPTTARLHSFTDAIALVGLFPKTEPITSYDTARAVLRNGNASVGVSTDKVQIKNSTDDLKTILTDLITAITTTPLIATTGASGTPSSLNPAISSLLSTVQTKINNLLES